MALKLLGRTFGIKVWQHKLDTIKAVLTQTNLTKDIGKRIIC